MYEDYICFARFCHGDFGLNCILYFEQTYHTLGMKGKGAVLNSFSPRRRTLPPTSYSRHCF